MADKKVTEQYYTPPPKLGKGEAFRKFLWNSETGQFMGRTAGSWGKILLFYLIFYASLAGFFAGLLAVFWTTLDMQKPKWELDDSLIGSNPGLGFRPMPPEAKLGSTLIWFRSSNTNNTNYWLKQIDDFLKPYKEAQKSSQQETRVDCDYNRPPPEGKVCNFDVNSLESCAPERSNHKYGYPEKKPCVYLKLNKIYNWYPELYNDTKNLPPNIPKYLIEYGLNNVKFNEEKNTVWVSCDGENPADVEGLGPVNYYPRRGFPAYYFPYRNIPGYLPPLVAIQFENPKPGQLINVECKAWAKNIIYDRYDRRGSVHFELMVD